MSAAKTSVVDSATGSSRAPILSTRGFPLREGEDVLDDDGAAHEVADGEPQELHGRDQGVAEHETWDDHALRGRQIAPLVRPDGALTDL